MNQHNAILDFGTKTCRINKGLRFITLFASQQQKENPVSPLLSSMQLSKALRKGAQAFFVQLR